MKSQLSKALWAKTLGYILCVLPPVLATLEHFPLWIKAGEKATFSFLGICVLLLCCIPLRRGIAAALRSPSAWQMWLVLLIVLYGARSIMDGLIAVSVVALPCSILGAFCFRYAKRISPPSKRSIS